MPKLKTLALSTVAAFVASNVLTTAYYMATATENTVSFAREVPNYGLLALNHLIFAAILSIVFPRYSAGGSVVGEGATFGALMGAMMFVPTGLVVRGIWQVEVNAIFASNCVFHIACGAVLGVLVAFIHGRKSA